MNWIKEKLVFGNEVHYSYFTRPHKNVTMEVRPDESDAAIKYYIDFNCEDTFLWNQSNQSGQYRGDAIFFETTIGGKIPKYSFQDPEDAKYFLETLYKKFIKRNNEEVNKEMKRLKDLHKELIK